MPILSKQERDISAVVGKNLEKLRKEQAITQKQLSALFDCSATMIYQYESGISRIPLPKAVILCDFLDCDINDLIEGVMGDE